MRGLLLDGGVRVVDDHPEPARAPGEAIVNVRVAGVCDTDVQLARGYMRFRGLLGHEFVGVVAASEDESWIGRRVVGDINASCGTCEDCVDRDGHHCPNRSVLGILGRDGALAERLALPVRNLVPVPDGVPDEHAVFAEPLAAAAHVLDVADMGVDEPVVVFGDGKLGQLIARALLWSGHQVIVVGHHEKKLELARSAGARSVLESALSNDNQRFRFVVEATGSPSGLSAALNRVGPRGTLVLKTTIAGETSVDLTKVVVDEVEIVGSRCGNMNRAIELLAARRVDPTDLIEARFPLERADDALELAQKPGSLKVLVVPGRAHFAECS